MMMENCELQLSVSRTAAEQDVELVLWPRARLSDLQRRLPDQLLRHLANVVNHGGLCGRSHPPVSSSFALSPAQLEADPLTRRFHVGGVAAGAWRVILGALVSHSVRGFPVERLALHTVGGVTGPELTAERAFRTPYPEAPDELPFPVERSELGSSTTDRLIRISFEKPPDDQVAAELVSALLSWDELSLGGFPEDGDSPLLNATDATEAYLVDSHTVEHPLPIYAGSELAFDAVICMAWWFHERGHRVARFSLW